MDNINEGYLRYITRFACGIAAGGAVYISIASHPARNSLEPSCRVKAWRSEFHRGKKMLAGIQLPITGLAVLSFAKTSDKKWLILLAPVAFNFGFTLLALHPINKKLLNESLKEDSDEALELHTKWGHLHHLRTIAFISMSAISLFIKCC